jgi:uncharacterized metal-binding protein YceD (DUF177 family)
MKITLDIKGLGDGKHDVERDIPSKEVEGMFDEFFGDIELDGSITKSGSRYKVSLELFCKANLICDISAEEFVEEILTNLELSFVADTERYFIQKDKEFDDDPEIFFHEEDNTLDITQEVVEQLAVSLPMKKVSPKYEDKDFKDIFPKISAENEEEKNSDEVVDARWEKLKNLKLN